jgi:hypothetical protein
MAHSVAVAAEGGQRFVRAPAPCRLEANPCVIDQVGIHDRFESCIDEEGTSQENGRHDGAARQYLRISQETSGSEHCRPSPVGVRIESARICQGPFPAQCDDWAFDVKCGRRRRSPASTAPRIATEST